MNQRRPQTDRFQISPARSLEDMAMIMAVRAATYMAEQDCPYAEEFDGNDFTGTQIIARRGIEPAGCIRLRYFSEFVKLERLAVMPTWRRLSLGQDLIEYAIVFAQHKGFSTFCAHVPNHTRLLWQSFGFTDAGSGAQPKDGFAFSGYAYREMHLTTTTTTNAVGLTSDPLVLIRPEGEWDRPGILENTSSRGESHTEKWGNNHDNIKRSA